MGLERFTPSAFTIAMSVLFLGFTIHAQLRILKALRGSKNPDPFLVLGIFATLAQKTERIRQRVLVSQPRQPHHA
jgi:hypothetical protein